MLRRFFPAILAAFFVLAVPSGALAYGGQLQPPPMIHAMGQVDAPEPGAYQFTFNRTLSGREYVTANLYTVARDVRGIRGLNLNALAGYETLAVGGAPAFGVGLQWETDFLDPFRLGLGVFALRIQGTKLFKAPSRRPASG